MKRDEKDGYRDEVQIPLIICKRPQKESTELTNDC
jgi:hypothetical protein